MNSFRDKLTIKLINLVNLVFKPKILGVRVAVFDQNAHVLLVKHSYVSGWYLPGGGIDASENPIEAAKRELFEETGLIVEEISLVDFTLNEYVSPRCFESIYKASVNNTMLNICTREIKDAAFFSVSDLPKEIHPISLMAIKNLTQ